MPPTLSWVAYCFNSVLGCGIPAQRTISSLGINISFSFKNLTIFSLSKDGKY